MVSAARVPGQSDGSGTSGRSNRDSIQNFDSGIERRIIFQTEFASTVIQETSVEQSKLLINVGST